MMKTNPYADLPTVILIEHVEDSGEYGNATCPHCGAQGRYVVWFRCTDGTARGAMKGCFSHFPKHPFVKEHQRILEKEKEYQGKGWNLPKWDQEILMAIEAFAAGEQSEQDTYENIAAAKGKASAWRNRAKAFSQR